jgi:hypothetical protein
VDLPGTPAVPAPVVAGRGTPIVEYALSRIRASRVLQASMVAAFMSYGALGFLLVSGRLRAALGGRGLEFVVASIVVLLSLASWAFLLLWYPALQRIEAEVRRDRVRPWMGRVLEIFAIGCVAVVHFLIAWLVVHLARG